MRVVSFEWREKHDGPRWRTTWLWANTIGSLGAPFIWGVALANLLNGVPLNSSHAFAGNFLDLFSPYTVLAGVAVVALFALHGATYLTLRTVGDLRERAAMTAKRLSIPAAVLGIAFVAWTVAVAHDHNARGVAPHRDPRRPHRDRARCRDRARACAHERLGVRDDRRWQRSGSSPRSSPASIRVCSSRSQPSPTA